MGPSCSGKTTLIDYLIHGKPELVVQAIPYTDRTVFRKEEEEDIDFKKPPENFSGSFFAGNGAGQDPEWLFNYKTDFINPVMSIKKPG